MVVNKVTTIECKILVLPVETKYVDTTVQVKPVGETSKDEYFSLGRRLGGFLYMGVPLDFLFGVLSQLEDLSCLNESFLKEMRNAKRGNGQSSS